MIRERYDLMNGPAKDMSAERTRSSSFAVELGAKQRDPAELRAEELAIREKFGLFQNTPLHDLTRWRSPLL